MTEKTKILVIKLGALGDFVQALGPMAAIRRHHPQADITLLTTAPFVTFGRDCGYFNHIWIDERPRWHNIGGWLALRQKLNEAGFGRVYDLQNNDRTGLYFRLFRQKPEWVGVASGASHRNDSPQRTAGPAFDGHAQTLKLAGIDDVALDDLSWIKGDITSFNLQKPYVLLVPGCAPSRPEKRWDPQNYGIIARTLYGWGYTPVIIGTAGEQDLARQIAYACPQAVDLTGKTALTDIVLLAREAAAAIGNDTGPMHLIAPTGCPCYVLFSQHSNPDRHAPPGPYVSVIRTGDLSTLPPDEVLRTLSICDFRQKGQQAPSESSPSQ